MERLAEIWGDDICGVIARYSPLSLRCSHVDSLSYFGLAVLVVLTVLALVAIMAAMSR